MLIKVGKRKYDSEAVSKIPEDDKRLLQAAISSVEPNNHYSEIHFRDEIIKFDPPIFLRASKKYTGRNVILAEKEELGRGKYGVVTEYEKIYLEEKSQSKKTGWVIKQVTLNNETEKEKFQKECERTKRIYPEVYFDTDKGYMVMPNLGLEVYTNILEDMDHTAVSFKTKSYFLDGFLSSLASVHEQGISHQDLKPQNVCFQIVDKLLRVNVFDFGLSDEVGEASTLKGSPGFIAPEMYKATFFANEKSDVFSAALTMLFMFLGDGDERYESEEIDVLDGLLFVVFDLIGVKKDSLNPTQFKEKAHQEIDKLNPETDLLAMMSPKVILKKMVDHYAEAYFTGNLHQEMIKNLKNHMEKYKYFVPQYQIDFFVKLFEKSTIANTRNRLSLSRCNMGLSYYF